MKMTAWSQRDGFHEVDFEAEDSDAPEEVGAWLSRLGFERTAADVDGDLDYGGYSLRVYYRCSEAKTQGWLALVDVDSWGDRTHSVLVANESDLLALRIAVAPLLMLNLAHQVQLLEDVAKRAFYIFHRHETGVQCASCEYPDEAAARREREQEKELRRLWAKKNADSQANKA
jgi:hypothetical protein